MPTQWLSADDASRRLGVKPETLYAYVSRGAVRRERVPGSRRSRYLRADIERLAARQRAGGRAGALEVIVETDLTLLDPAGALYYRGWNVADAVRGGATFEEIATWLLTGTRDPATFRAPAEMLAVAHRVAGALEDQPAIDRMRAVVVAVRHADPLRYDRRPSAVASTARSLIALLVEALPPLAPGSIPAGASVARRLWPRVSPEPPRRKAVALLDTALVLLADHELAASTLAARVAASTWADPYLVVQAGLAALGGPLHAGASRDARRLLREVIEGRPAAEVIGARLRDGELIAGFGHRIYDDRDPRADLLLTAIAGAGAPTDAELELVATMQRHGLPFPNVELAMASLMERHQMIDDAGEVIFSLARTAGWLAHATEEYAHRLRFRPRAVYTGPAPG